MRTVVYVRQSLDRDGSGAAVSRQREDAENLARLRGWEIVATYTDNDVSAAGKKARPGFEATLDALDNGTAKAVIAWSLDRLTRNRRDTLRLIETAEKSSATIALVRGSDLDMSTPSGRLVADLLAATARSEIDIKGDRQRRATRQRAMAGRPFAGGRRPYGFEADGITHRPDEAARIRSAFETILGGGSIRGIVTEWNNAGYPSAGKGQWTTQMVRNLLLRPRLAGLSALEGEILGPAVWEPIVDEATWRAVGGILRDPARRTTPDTRRKYLLSGLALCFCGAIVTTGRTQYGSRTYMCSAHRHLSRKADTIDDFVSDVVIARLSRDDARDLARRDDDTPNVATMQGQAQALRARLDELVGLFTNGDITASQLASGSQRIRDELADVEARIAAAAESDVLGGIVNADDIAERWAEFHVDRKRAVISTLMTITLHSPGRGAKRLDPDTIGITWRQS